MKLGINNSNGNSIRSQIITRRNNVKKQLATLVITGLAVATVFGAVAVGNMGNVVHAEPEGRISDVAGYVGTSPDLPELDGKVVRTSGYANTSPDLPEIDGDSKVVRFAGYANTSPDLPEMEMSEVSSVAAKIELVRDTFANTSPDLPELNQDAKVVRFAGYANTSPDLPEMDNDTKIVRVAGYANTSPDLPEMEMAEASSVAAKIELVRDTFANTSPDLPELDQDAKIIRAAGYANTSPDLPELDNDIVHNIIMVGDRFDGTSPDQPEIL